jgi:hypothetical protein
MDRVGLGLFPNAWTGNEYRDHWRLGLNPRPPTKLRGMAAERELLRLVADRLVSVEREIGPDEFAPVAPAEVRHFQGSDSLVAGEDEAYHPCRLRFPPVGSGSTGAGAGRKPFDYPDAVVRICRHLDLHGCKESADRITHTILAQIEREGGKPPHYSKLQPYVSAMLAYRREQQFPESILGSNGCD